jgi:serine/threonine protein kinase
MISFILTEANIMRQLKHKNIVGFRDIVETQNNIFILME